MARTRQKKRVLTTQPKELVAVAEDEPSENLQPNSIPATPEPELDPSPPKQIRLAKKSTATKVERLTRATVKRTASRANMGKSDSVPTPPPPPLEALQVQPPRSVSTIPALLLTEDNSEEERAVSPEIRISRVPIIISGNVKSVSIAVPVTASPEKDEHYSPNSSRQSNKSLESPRDVSTEQARDYMSPNDALSSTTMYATLGTSLSPQIYNSKGRLDLSDQSTEPASSTYFRKNVLDKSIMQSCNQSIGSVSNYGITFYFIGTSDDENSEIMEKAYFCLVSRGFSASWLAEKDVPNLPDNEDYNLYFVLPEFEGSLFEMLRDHPKWKVFSPSSLLHFHSQPIPVRDYPIIDFSMKNCFITVSGFPRDLRKNLEDKMKLMSGQISSSIKDRTTHVVASSWNTEKCMYARTHGYPLVMSPDWVEYCWENINSDEPVDALELSYNNRLCRLPIFAGFVITSANLSPQGQTRLCDLVIEHGGVYQNVIDPFRTTHLVIVKREGIKYERALENSRIQIVQPDWIYESIARGYPLLEQDMTVKKIANKMFSKFMDFMGVVSTVFTDSFTNSDRSSTLPLANDVRVPGSPELSEDENDENENSADDEEPNGME